MDRDTMQDWPHAPPHWLFKPGLYMVTAGTYQKAHYFRTPARLTFLQQVLFAKAAEFGWQLQAWAVFSNHYHFVGKSPDTPQNLTRLIQDVHSQTAKVINDQDKTAGRKIWYQFWDSQITFEPSYLARLNYVQKNPVHHNLVTDACDYEWCSASWFKKSAPKSFVKTVDSFKVDRVNVFDEF